MYIIIITLAKPIKKSINYLNGVVHVKALPLVPFGKLNFGLEPDFDSDL